MFFHAISVGYGQLGLVERIREALGWRYVRRVPDSDLTQATAFCLN